MIFLIKAVLREQMFAGSKLAVKPQATAVSYVNSKEFITIMRNAFDNVQYKKTTQCKVFELLSFVSSDYLLGNRNLQMMLSI